MGTRPSAIIIGGSMGGLVTALYLRKIGFEVAVFERGDVYLSGRGAGIVSHPELEAMLSELGISNPGSLGFPTSDRKFLDATGATEVIVSRAQNQFSWNKLYNALLDLLGRENYHLLHDVVEVLVDSSSASATFSNGRTVNADLLIGADGLASRVRGQNAPEVQPLYAGYVGWRGIVEASAVEPHVSAELGKTFVMATPRNEQFVGYPVVLERPEGDVKCYNYVWYRPAPAETTLRDLLTDATGVTHRVGIPPPMIRPELIDNLRSEAARVLPPQLAAVVKATPQPFLQPIYDLTSSKMVFGRNVLIGDAAFVARPHVGAGVTKAASDACALARCLADEGSSFQEALERFEKERLREGYRIVDQARYLGRALTGGAKIEAAELIRETAWLSFLEREYLKEVAL